MRTHLIMVVAILAAGSAAALVANTAWYKMEWVREEIKNTSQVVVDLPSPGADVPEEGSILIDAVLGHLAGQTAFFVDAREQNDYDEGRLRGAIFIPSSDIYGNVDDNLMASGVAVTDLIIVYCGGVTCDASHNVADALRRDYGFENVLIYKNGWEEIEESGRFDDYIVVGDES